MEVNCCEEKRWFGCGCCWLYAKICLVLLEAQGHTVTRSCSAGYIKILAGWRSDHRSQFLPIFVLHVRLWLLNYGRYASIQRHKEYEVEESKAHAENAIDQVSFPPLSYENTGYIERLYEKRYRVSRLCGR